MKDWPDARERAENFVSAETAWMLWMARAMVLLFVVLVLLFLAFRAAVAATPERGSVPYFEALGEDDLAAVIGYCRDNAKHAETPSCTNAELAFNRRYAEVLRRKRLAMLRSPLFWIENPIMAQSVRQACARHGQTDSWAFPYCAFVPPGKMT